MAPWTFRPADEGWAADLGPGERSVLLEVVDEVLAMLRAQRPQWPGPTPDPDPVDPPTDPALRRLLPDASRGAPDVAREFRRLTEADLREAKAANLEALRAALAAGPRLVLAPDDAPAVAAALTDVRLVVAERLGVRTEEDADAAYRLAQEAVPDAETDPAGFVRAVLAILLAVLAALQDSLVELMLDALPDDAGDMPHHAPDEPPGDTEDGRAHR